jgi:hypothetical protein
MRGVADIGEGRSTGAYTARQHVADAHCRVRRSTPGDETAPEPEAPGEPGGPSLGNVRLGPWRIRRCRDFDERE